MRKLLSFGLAAGFLAVSATSHADSLLEKIAVAVLADKFGIDTRQVIILQEQTHLPVYELAPIYEGAHYFKCSPSTVWQLRRQGLGWGQIAHKVGMHPGTFNKLRNQGAFDRDRFWATSYRERFAVPTERVVVIQKAGGTLEDVLASILIGKLTNKEPSQVYDQFRTQRTTWTTIATNSNVQFESWRRIAVPVKTRYVIVEPKEKSVPPGHRSDERGNGNASHKDAQDKPKGKSSGNGNGKGKGDGNGRGHGNGNGHGKGHGG